MLQAIQRLFSRERAPESLDEPRDEEDWLGADAFAFVERLEPEEADLPDPLGV